MVANWDWVLYNFRLPLARALQRAGVKVFLVCPPGDYIQKIETRGFEWIPWQLNRRSTSPLGELVSIFELIRIYRDLKPSAVHHITIKPIFYGSIAAIFFPGLQVINNFTGLGYLFSEDQKAGWLRKFLLPVFRLVLKRKYVHTVILNPEDQLRLQRAGVIVPERSTIITSEGVDLKRFQPGSTERDPSNPPVFLLAARLLWDKGIAEFVKAAALLNEQGYEAAFWIAGRPDPANPSSLTEDEYKQLKENDFVEMLGHTNVMSDLLNQADVAVLPSYHEGVPLFLLEAAASGLPLIGTDIEGCRLIIEEGWNGFRVPTGDEKSLAESMIRLLENPDLRRLMGQRSRQRAEEEFSKERVNREFIQLYQALEIIPN